MPEIEPVEPKIVKAGEIQKEAEELKKRLELPKKPGQRVRFPEMLEWLKLLSPEQEEQIVIYVYRLDPPIIRQKVNPDAANNIDVISDGFKFLDEKYFIDRMGGGRYGFTVKNLGYKPRTGSDDNGYFEANLMIPMSQYPPKNLDLREVNWEDPKSNGFKAWAVAQGMIDRNGNVIEIKPKDGTTQLAGNLDPNMVSMMKMMLDFTTKMSEKDQTEFKRKIGGEEALSKSMGDLMLEKMKQDDPNKQISTMTALIAALVPKEGKGEGTLAVIVPLITSMMSNQMEQMKMASDASNKQFQLMIELMRENKTSGEGEEKGSSKLEELKALIDIAREIKGGGVAHEKSTAEVVGDIITPILGPVLNIVANITAARAGVGGQVAPLVNQRPASATEAIDNMNKQQLPPATGTSVPPNEAAQIITQFEPIIINKLASPGWEFGAWVADGFGDMTAAGIVKYGPEALLEAAKSVPSFWGKIQATYGEAHLRKWLESLCNYKSIMEQLENEDEADEEPLPRGIKELPKK